MDFSAAEVMTASYELSARIALAEEIAAGTVAALLDVLTEREYIENRAAKLDDVVIGNPSMVSEKRYRLTARRIAEISGIASAIDEMGTTQPGAEPVPTKVNALPRIGRFVPEAELGRGGMGTVYRALDPLKQGYVALKVMQGSPLGFARHRERFLREIKALESLRHENIVRFLEAGESDSVLYLAMI